MKIIPNNYRIIHRERNRLLKEDATYIQNKVSIIVPAYNEESAIVATVTELCEYIRGNIDFELIIVNDGSTDGTARTLKDLKENYNEVKILHHKKNLGYGSAIKTGVKNAKGNYIAWYDADGQHRPSDLMNLVEKIMDEDWDYCIGVRSQDSYEDPSRKLGKGILRAIVNFCAREKTEDFNSGMRVFKTKILLKYLSLLPNRFGASTVTTLLMQESGYIGGGVTITVKKRIGKSSVRQIKDGLHTIGLIFQIILLFRPMQIFGGCGITTMILGCVYGLAKVMTLRQGFPTFGAVIIIFGIHFCVLGVLSSQISQVRLEMLNIAEQQHTIG